ARLRPVVMPEGSAASHAVFHRVGVAGVDRLTEDSVLITFAVPAELRELFAFTAGQHITVRTNLGGEGVRRNYSICSPATSTSLPADEVDEWFLCGPLEMVAGTRETLLAAGVVPEHVHVVLFHGYATTDGGGGAPRLSDPCTVTFRLSGLE